MGAFSIGVLKVGGGGLNGLAHKIVLILPHSRGGDGEERILWSSLLLRQNYTQRIVCKSRINSSHLSGASNIFIARINANHFSISTEILMVVWELSVWEYAH